jgi:hypothetical protein
MHVRRAGRSAVLLIMLSLILAAALLPPPRPVLAEEEKAPGKVAESTSYELTQAVFGSAGRQSSGASYSMNGTLGQPHPVGPVSGTSYSIFAGFWNWIIPVATDASDMPLAFRLSQNYPNPFNPVTTIEYSISGKVFVDLMIFDVSGRRVRTLVSEKQLPGGYSVVWDGRNDGGRPVASGVYFYRLDADKNSSVKKMVILR